MKSLISTPALKEKITEMKKKREKKGWTADDEQMLYLLLGALECRSFFHPMALRSAQPSEIDELQDEMQKESDLLNSLNRRRKIDMSLFLSNNGRKRAGFPLHRKGSKRKCYFANCEVDEIIEAFLDHCDS